MTGTEKLEALMKSSKGVIIAKLADAHGIYITPEVWEDKMLIHQLRKGKMVYSHETALFLNDLTDRDLVAYCLTLASVPSSPPLETISGRTIWSIPFAIFFGTEITRMPW